MKKLILEGPPTIEEIIREAQRAVIDVAYVQFIALGKLLGEAEASGGKRAGAGRPPTNSKPTRRMPQ